VMLFFHPSRMGLAQALDLETDGLARQAARIRLVEPSRALILATLVMVGGALAWQVLPQRETQPIVRDSFAAFPRELGAWRQEGPPATLDAEVEKALNADDYRSVTLVNPAAAAEVGLFMAWYADQSDGGVHPPEVCLPGSGWEIAWLERTDVAGEVGSAVPFNINQAIIQRGETRMMVYYWFEQHGRKVAWDFAAKFYLLVDGVTTGRTDGALVRLTTRILPGESDTAAAARLNDVMKAVAGPLPRFVPQD
jgi:EpsI family protein